MDDSARKTWNALFATAATALAPGGILIAETVTRAHVEELGVASIPASCSSAASCETRSRASQCCVSRRGWSSDRVVPGRWPRSSPSGPGTTLHVSGIDLLDGTPVLDIKPYVPAFDVFDAERTGWLEQGARRVHEVKADQ